MDVPDPNDQGVLEFAASAKLGASKDDENAKAWTVREGTRLVGKYINLTEPKVMRPWVGLIASNQRIDGRWTGGRLDFRSIRGNEKLSWSVRFCRLADMGECTANVRFRE
jgi:hypothetical protein